MRGSIHPARVAEILIFIIITATPARISWCGAHPVAYFYLFDF